MTEDRRNDTCMSEVVCRLKHEADQKAVDLKVEAVNARIDGMDRALILRASELERRLEGLNELRSEVTRDRDLYLQKTVYDIKTDIYDRWMQDMSRRMTIQETRSILWTSAIGAGVVLLQIVLHLWK